VSCNDVRHIAALLITLVISLKFVVAIVTNEDWRNDSLSMADRGCKPVFLFHTETLYICRVAMALCSRAMSYGGGRAS